jgi:hypothetical protein
MRRENNLYDDERPLPYYVELARIDGAPIATPTITQSAIRPALIYLDLRGGEFSRPTTYRLAKTFDWLVKAFQVRTRDINEYALLITPIPPRRDAEITGDRIPYIHDDWPDLQKRSFLWVPVAFNDREESYAWQRT